MRLLSALADTRVRRLWSGQALSAVGDEVYNIAMVWFAAEMIGLSAGYLSAVQAASVFTFSLIGGLWADHTDHRRVMIAVDLVRGGAVLILPVIAWFTPLTLWMLVPVAITVSSLSAFFNPALSAYLPEIIDEPELLRASNALMETTGRLARNLGPGVVGALSAFIPLVHYFTIVALSFFSSAWSVSGVHAKAPAHRSTSSSTGVWSGLLAGHRLTCSQPTVAYVIFTGGIAGAGWLFVFPLGMALHVRAQLPADVGALGLLVFAYGIGNLSSNILISGFAFARPARWMFLGRLFSGVGFMLFSGATTLPQMMACCALTAVGGPVADLGFINLLQKYFRDADLARVLRYGMALAYGGLLVLLLLSPQLFSWFSVSKVIFSCAVVIFVCGAAGFVFTREPAS